MKRITVSVKVIYAGFNWSQAKTAYQKTIKLAAKYEVGFFDASGTCEIWIPDGSGGLKLLKESESKPGWKFW